MSEHDALTVRIAESIRAHQPTTGMKVAMGETCACGYWTGRDRPGKERPVGYQGLQWHQATVIRELLAVVPDENAIDRGFGNCPHCLSAPVVRCHECLRECLRDQAHGFGWRMDHLGGFGCIALCPDHR